MHLQLSNVCYTVTHSLEQLLHDIYKQGLPPLDGLQSKIRISKLKDLDLNCKDSLKFDLH